MCGAESWLKGKGRCLLKHNLPFWSNNDKKQCHGNETEATQPASISEPNTLKALPPRLPEAGWDLPCAALPCLLCFPQGCVAKQGAPGLNNACGTTYAFCRTRDLCKAGFPAGAAGACCSLSGPAACHLLWEQAAESMHRDGVSKLSASSLHRANQPAATRNSRGLKMAPAFWDRQRVSCCLWSRAPQPDASCSDASHPELAVQTEPLHPDITSLVCYGTYSISPTLSRPQAYQGLKGNPPLQGGEVVSLWKHCIRASA
nr:uncharacterized protein LOC101794246 isoform X3 [Anas platyrhynchos]|eukprot:XP_027319782.1 uncharacterized protein LOC101794246 [Anas platyrhynchos]